ncbi:MAG: hypothetical protein C4567_09430 [Deltaproteobacteria bacterium]|nr:MAG: hypothetical protein C4567_09430 [Deltaproteobacteria bacterium]
MMDCEKYFLGIRFVTPPIGLESPIFGFATFVQALALLVIIYMITDIRYRFRLKVAPIPLLNLTFILIGVIGIGTLLTDIWFANGWPMPNFLADQSMLQGLFGFIFLLLAMIWIYYAFINPPIFSEKNCRSFGNALYGAILRGLDSELPIIANELARSAKPLVKLSKQIILRRRNTVKKPEVETKRKPNVGDFAHDILLLMGNRKLCRHIIASSPVSAIEFFEAMTINEKYELPIGQFAKNISAEAIINKDSILYHEDEGFSSGLIGYLKPFSKAIYGNYLLVETLGSNFGSPLDIPYGMVFSWDAEQLKVYCRAVKITFKGYLEGENWYQHSFVLYRAFENIKNSLSDIYKLNDILIDYYSTDIFKRLKTVVDFIKEIIKLIDKQETIPVTKLRVRGERTYEDFYDNIANFIFEIILSAASVTAPPDKCWTIHYNAVWREFFSLLRKGKVWKIVHFKLRRILYDEIRQLEELPNYKSSAILGFCLNVMGLKIREKQSYNINYYPLHKAVLAWASNNYLRLKSTQPDVAKSCLIGSISFDEQGNQLVKTYLRGLELEAQKEYLELNPMESCERVKKMDADSK